MRRILTALAVVFSLNAGAAWAQAITNVNECTLISDPIALKRCIDGFQNRGPAAQYPQSEPLPPIATPAQAERERLTRNPPPNTSYKDSPEWLGPGTDRRSGESTPKGRVIDLNRD